MVNRRFRYGFLVSSLAVLPVAGCASDMDAELVESSPAALGSNDVVISQIYGGGGNSGAQYKNDFIELFNVGASPVDLATWSVQYASATGNSWSKVNLSGVLQPGRYYLIQAAAGTGGVLSLPAPDAIGSMAMSASSGKVALVTNQTLLACSTACLPSAAIRDFVGYGSLATGFEGSGPAVTLSSTTSALRLGGGCSDSDDNKADFSGEAPNPHNSASTGVCSSTGARIRDIQGAAHRSPLVGASVLNVPGVVTGKRTNGFYMQDPAPDANPATSEGIFVFTSIAPTVNVGDSITVNGRVSEFRSGGASSMNLTLTQLSSPTISVSSRGNALPAPVVIGRAGRMPPTTIIDDDATGDVETSGMFDPATDGIDFYESLEAMLVQVNNAVAVGPTNGYGELPVVGDRGANATVPSSRRALAIRPGDFNPERIMVDDVFWPTPVANVGDRFSAPLVGIIDSSFGNFKLGVTQPNTLLSGGITREVTEEAAANQLVVATFNVENLDPGDPSSKFATLADLIVNNLRSPDILVLEEIQDNNGPTNDSVVDASQTFAAVIGAIVATGGPVYDYRQVNPLDDTNGGEPGGNIRVGFIFRTDRGIGFIDRPGGSATAATTVVSGAGGAELSFSPGLVDPTQSVFSGSRKPLVGEFTFAGHHLFLIGNHFNSKGGDDPLFGRIQPPTRSSEVQRGQQAQIVHDFVGSILTVDPNAEVVVLGDINDFQFSSAVTTLAGALLHPLINTLPESERYSYVFEGNAQALDHILVSNKLFNGLFSYDVVHVNAEFAVQASDHDPQLVRLY